MPGLPVLPVLLLLATACAEPRSGVDEPVTLHGPEVRLHDGSARAYVLTAGERPIEVGVAVDEAFVDALPEEGAPGGVMTPEGHSVFEYVLELPDGHGTPYDHVTLDWNPTGHEPPGIYDAAHFDVHFYMISEVERQAIRPDDPAFDEKAGRLPEGAFMPSGYVDPEVGAVPMMGVHLVDPASPELRPDDPEPFTRTFIYGSWDGRLVFLEPMVTAEFLAERGEETRPIAMAERYDPPGYYPSSYSIRWDEEAAEHRIALVDLVWKE